MPARLIALNGGPSILVDKPILLVGRHPECDIQIDSRKISRRHCCIAQVSDYLVVRDLGSTNGVRVNGSRVAESRLGQGDELTLGNHRYQVRWDALAPPALPVPRPGARETFRAPDQAAEDELLESCDQPIALEEPRGRIEESGCEHPPVEAEDGPSSSEEMPLDQRLAKGSSGPILPDDLELRPPSGGAAPAGDPAEPAPPPPEPESGE